MHVLCREKPKRTFAGEWSRPLRKVFRKRGGSGLRSSSRYGEPLDGPCGTRRTSSTESTTSRKASRFAIGTASSSHDGAPHYQRLPGPVELALCAVDEGSGARVAVPKV